MNKTNLLMKTLLLCLCMVGSVSAWAAVNNTTVTKGTQKYIDVASTAASNGDEVTVGEQYIAYTVNELVASSIKGVWYTQQSSTSGSSESSSISITGYRSSNSKYVGCNSTSKHTFYVTNCVSFSALFDPRSSNRPITITATNIDDDTEDPLTMTYSGSMASGTYVSAELTGMTASKYYKVEVTCSNSQSVRIGQIRMEAQTDTRTAVTLSFPEASYNATLGSSFSSPELTVSPAAASSAVTYTSSNEAAATVNTTTGAITLVAGGTTTITAAISGNATYRDATASYILKVKDPDATGYDDEATTVTWSMASGSTSSAVVSPEDAALSTSWAMGSNMSVYSTRPTGTWNGYTFTEFFPSKKVTSSRSAGHYVDFTFTPRNGLTFTPTGVSFVAYKIGTGGGTVDVDLIDGGGNTIQLATGASVIRNNDSSSDPTKTYTVSTAVESQNAVTLRIWIANIDAGNSKTMGICNVVISGTVNGTPEDVTTHTIAVVANDDNFGVVGGGGEIVEGQSTTLTATANTGYVFVNWTKASDNEWSSTENPLEVDDVQADETYTANFQQVTRVKWETTYAGTYGKMGTNYAPANGVNERWADADNKFTIPSYMHKYFYREGYRFNKWQVVNDGTSNRYNSGDEVTITNDAISSYQATIKPAFVATTATLDTSLAPTTVTWSFAKSDMVFCDWQCSDENKYEYYTVTATVNGETIDVPMKITKGKVANYTRTDAIAQTNQNTKMTIPAVKGMVVTIADAYTNFSTTTIAGSTEYTGSGTKTISYTYTGEDTEISIVIGENNQYLRTIQVVYPAVTETVTVAASGWTSLASVLPLDFANAEDSESNKDLKAYVISNITSSAVTLTSVESAPAETGLILKGTASTAYTIPVSESPETISKNELSAAVEDTEVSASTVYVVSGGELKLFTGTEIPAGKAYLLKSKVDAVTTDARSLSFVFDDGETTGISNVEDAQRQLLSGDFFNLAGQRVAAPAKGLYIVNGKKVIIK